MKISENNVIGQLVAEDYRTAEVFGKYGIDFCCKGDLTIAAVCDKKKIDRQTLISDLQASVETLESGGIDYKSWPLDLLADYIEKKHHRYVEAKIPVIRQYLHKVASVHGTHHPELFEIEKQFNGSADALTTHMKKEELILFPFIRKMVLSFTQELPGTTFGTIENPVNMMKHEHDIEGERFRTIAKLSNNYTPPADACNTFKVSYALLKEFEADLHLHVHLENNILFPRAIELEASRQGASCQV